MSRLHALNLNLLVALDALLEERSVGRAAQRVGVTQSAMSHTLRQLRALFEDPLLVRAGRRMVPTPRADQLAPKLRSALGALDAGWISRPPRRRTSPAGWSRSRGGLQRTGA